MSDAVQCVECGHALGGPVRNFCPGCGQPATARRIDWTYLVEQVRHGVLNLERGLGYSLRNLLLRPGRLMRDYIEGRRARQVRPLPLLLLGAAAVVLVGRVAAGGDVIGSAVLAGVEMSGNPDPDAVLAAQDSARAVQAWANRHFAAITLLLLPVEALALRVALHRVGGLNYPEWLVISTFLTVQAFMFWIAGLLLQRWIPGATGWAMSCAIAFQLFSLAQFFAGYPWWKSVLRGALGLCLYTVVQSAITLAAFAVAALVR